MRFIVAGCLTLMLGAPWSCSPCMGAPPGAGSQQTAQANTKIDSIVFIDKVDACPCTQARIDSSWKALQTALKSRTGIQVRRVHFDTEKAIADRYVALKPLMVLPGIYFLNGRGGVVDMLQGEVRLAQIVAALKKDGPAT